MLTVTALARHFHVSRAAILYYEREGLLKPARRSANGYRWYGEPEIERLEAILAYRSFGMPVADIRRLMEQAGDDVRETVLRGQFERLEHEIRGLRRQQQAIVVFLNHPELLEEQMITKDRWVEIMRAAGLSEDDMRNWHRQFEKLEPRAHREFLESLHISAEEIGRIREQAAAERA